MKNRILQDFLKILVVASSIACIIAFFVVTLTILDATFSGSKEFLIFVAKGYSVVILLFLIPALIRALVLRKTDWWKPYGFWD